MPTYLTPGIYVEEISTGSRPIEAVGTSTAAFIGVAPNPDAHLHQALGINNWSQFIKEYSGQGATSTPLSQAVYGFFLNGGGRCYIVNIGPKKELVGDGKQRKGIETLEEVDEVAIVAAPGFSDAASYDTILSHCEKLQDRVAILDAPENVPNIDLLKSVATSGTAKPKKGAGDATATADATPPAAGLRARTSDGGYGAYYFPWITIRDPFSPKDLVNAPPSGHIAGVINPPGKQKYQYWDGPKPTADADVDEWLAKAKEHAGSWWPDWLAWLKKLGAEEVPARVPGAGKLKAIEDAPGSFVKVRD